MLEALAVNNVWRMLRKSRPLWVSVRNAAIFNIVWMGYGFFHRTVVSRRIWGARSPSTPRRAPRQQYGCSGVR